MSECNSWSNSAFVLAIIKTSFQYFANDVGMFLKWQYLKNIFQGHDGEPGDAGIVGDKGERVRIIERHFKTFIFDSSKSRISKFEIY